MYCQYEYICLFGTISNFYYNLLSVRRRITGAKDVTYSIPSSKFGERGWTIINLARNFSKYTTTTGIVRVGIPMSTSGRGDDCSQHCRLSNRGWTRPGEVRVPDNQDIIFVSKFSQCGRARASFRDCD